jgi:hypothetical protein
MEEVRALIKYYDERGWDWRLAVEFLLWRQSTKKRCRYCGM